MLLSILFVIPLKTLSQLLPPSVEPKSGLGKSNFAWSSKNPLLLKDKLKRGFPEKRIIGNSYLED